MWVLSGGFAKCTGEPIPEADLEIILEAGRWAATSNNRQARRFALIAGDQVPGFSAEAKMQPWVAGAGALAVGWSTIAESLGAAADVTISLTRRSRHEP
ncbi:MAG: nitroreductase family protein [Bacillota bacterium]